MNTVRKSMLTGLASLLIFQPAYSDASGDLRTVALFGDAISVGGANLQLSPSGGILNSNGDLAYVSSLFGAGADTSNDIILLLENVDGTRRILTREVDQVPGAASGVLHSGSLSAHINSNGQIAAVSEFIGPGTTDENNLGLLLDGPNGLQLFAQKGDFALSASSGVTFRSFRNTVYNDRGEVAFFSALAEQDADFFLPDEGGIFLGSIRDGIRAVARTGDIAVGADATIKSFLDSFSMNSSGQIAFRAILQGEDFDGANDGAIYLAEADGSLTPVAVTNGEAPGRDDGMIFGRLSNPTLNDRGDVAFVGVTQIGADVFSGGIGVFSTAFGNGLSSVAYNGDQVPGNARGVQIEGVGAPALNSRGQATFVSTIEGPTINDFENDLTILKQGASGELLLVAQTGDLAPGADSDSTFSFLNAPSINARGQVIFRALLDGQAGGEAIYAEDTFGILQMIVRTGDSIDVSNNPLNPDFREVSSIGFTNKFDGGAGNEDGRMSAFNDLGQIAFNATFTDGTRGFFVSNVVAIPEPANALLCLAGSVWYLAGVRRH